MAEKTRKASLLWKTLERLGYHGVKLLVQILLARILAPNDFGVLSIILVFIDIATILVQSGLNTALIQNKESTSDDFSTVFWFSLFFSFVLYAIVFTAAPLIALFFENDSITNFLRVLGIMLVGGAINSIQIAYCSRNNDFKTQFLCNFIAVTISGVVAIYMAYVGCGIWSLIVQQIVWQYLLVFTMGFAVKWRPRFVLKMSSLKKMFSFGWKMLVSSLFIRMNSIVSNLIIGKKYTDDDLGYYSKALSFPTVFSDVAVTAISSVALVDFSKKQENLQEATLILKKYISHTMFFVAPIMFGMIAISKPFVSVLLTDKWLGCVEFLRIFCLMYLFQPVCSIYGQAISGVGRSDLYLKAYLVSKPAGLVLIFISAFMFNSPIYVALALVVTSIIETAVQAFNVKKVFGIKIREQIKNWLPSILISLGMFSVCYAVSYIPLNNVLVLLIQIVIGITVYFLLNIITKNRVMLELLNNLKLFFQRRK